MNEIDNRVETARKLGSDPSLVLHGGGNASVKLIENDHAGRIVKVLRVKGSGSDMATIESRNFTGLRMEDLLHARSKESMSDIEMMDYLKKSMVDPSEPSPSVETFLHAFIPYSYVDHTHSDYILALTNSGMAHEEIKNVLGNVLVVDYVMPGFKLAQNILKIVGKITPDVEGIVLINHGLFTFGETADESYSKHMNIVERAKKFIKEQVGPGPFHKVYEKNGSFAQRLPELRGIISKNFKKVLLVDRGEEALEVCLSEEGKAFASSGPATPDMLIRTKYDYLYLEGKEDLNKAIDSFVRTYTNDYKQYVKGFPMHDPFPSVIIVQGFGIITAARNMKECRIIRDQIVHSFMVNATASVLGKQAFISRKDAMEMEYWPLEEAKLKKFVPRPMEGLISLVTGGANGIGLETLRKLAQQGSTVIGVDISKDIHRVASEASEQFKTEVKGYAVDLTNPDAIRSMVRDITSTYGGIDLVFHNAGILKSEYIEEVSIDTLIKHFEVNSLAPFVLTQETFKVMKQQGMGGNYIFNITKNLTNPGPGMVSYGSTKAFAAHLCHYVAKEGGKYGIRSNIINPDKIFKNSKIWENGVLEARARAKGITPEEYKKSNLLRREVLPEYVANVVVALANEDIFGATTDAMIPVDGGIL